jgi:hypothetical protein
MLGPIIAAGGDLLGGFLSSQASQRRQEDAHNFSAHQFATRYQTTTADMKAAGLNPMLAYSQGGGSPAGGVSASGGDFGRPGTAAVNADLQTKMNSAQVANIEADTLNKRALAGLIEAQISQTGASADSLRTGINVMDAQFKEIVSRTENYPLEGQRLKTLVQQLASSANLMQEQGLTQSTVRSQLFALIGKLKSETKLLDLDYQAADSLGNIGREAGQLKPIVDVLLQVLKIRR